MCENDTIFFFIGWYNDIQAVLNHTKKYNVYDVLKTKHIKYLCYVCKIKTLQISLNTVKLYQFIQFWTKIQFYVE